MIPRRAMLAGPMLALVPWRARAADQAALDAAIREAVGDAVPVDGGIELRVPATAENGAQVPLAVLVDSPMTEADHVVAIHVFATRNPTPGIATFHLFPGLARAEVHTRIRVAEDQAIVVLARHSGGTLRRASASLKVTRGGCLS
jgi:sulfur-oxidizing protein SoxY